MVVVVRWPISSRFFLHVILVWRRLIGPRLGPLDLDLLVLDVDEVFCDGARTSSIVPKRQEAEATTFLLLLVVHDDDFDDLAVAREERPQISLRNARGEASQKYLNRGRNRLLNIDCLIRNRLKPGSK
jgi:hypothetical protein